MRIGMNVGGDVLGLPTSPLRIIEHAERAEAEEAFGRYNGMQNYQRLFERERVTGVADLAVIGTETEVTARLDNFAAVGVTEIWAVPYGDEAQVRRTRDVLAGLVAA